MPSAYAHDRFGRLVMEKLPGWAGDVLARGRDLYFIGLQGPDIFYYYNPLFPNQVWKDADRLHDLTGRRFFRRERRAAGLPEMDDAEAVSYLMGLVCHFTLDSMVHAFVEDYKAKTGIPHITIEGEFDRYLIASEGRDPVREVLTENFHPSPHAAEVITRFYPWMGRRVIDRSLRRVVSLSRLIYCPHKPRRELIFMAMKMAGKYDQLKGHIMSDHPEPGCGRSNAYLEKKMQEAVPVAVRLISSLREETDDPQYQWDFCGIKHPEEGKKNR